MFSENFSVCRLSVKRSSLLLPPRGLSVMVGQLPHPFMRHHPSSCNLLLTVPLQVLRFRSRMYLPL